MRQIAIIISLAISLLSFSVMARTFTLKSESLTGEATNETFFNNFGCSGDNKSPEPLFSSAPDGTKSFAVIIYDADAPTSSGFRHLVVFDIPAQSKSIAVNPISTKSQPNGSIESNTDFVVPSYVGPCPPEGDKPYMFMVTVYDMETEKLGLDAKC